jgi:hypothetical protein
VKEKSTGVTLRKSCALWNGSILVTIAPRLKSLRELLLSGYPQELLEKELREFSCSRDSDIETFIRTKAIDYERSGLGRTYLYLDGSDENTNLVAYITIAITSVDYAGVSRSRRKKVLSRKPGRDSKDNFPGLLIGQLARDDRYDSTLISGSDMIADAESLIDTVNQTIGGMLIYLDCKDDLIKLYERNGYELLSDKEPDNGLYKMFKPLPKLPL